VKLLLKMKRVGSKQKHSCIYLRIFSFLFALHFPFNFIFFKQQQTAQFVQTLKPIIFANPGQTMKVNGKDLVFTNLHSNSSAKVTDRCFVLTLTTSFFMALKL